MEQKQATAPSTGSIDLAQQEVALELFWDKWKSTIIQAAIAVAVIGLAFWIWKVYIFRQERDARKLLISAKTDADYQNIISKYATTSSSAESLAYLGKKAFEEKKYAEAAGYYETFLNKFSDHALASVVGYSYGLTLQYGGKEEEAKKIYERNLTDADRKAVAGGSALQLAEIYKKQGKLEEARKVLQNFKRENPQSAFIPNIEFALGQLEQK